MLKLASFENVGPMAMRNADSPDGAASLSSTPAYVKLCAKLMELPAV